MKKNGLTLIELLVAMSIFIIVIMLAVGGFISISKTRSNIGSMKDTQQKARLVSEMIIRYAKQAEYVQIDPQPAGTWAELYFDSYTTAMKFAAVGNDLLYYVCPPAQISPGGSCSNWGTGTSLLGGSSTGISLSNTNIFRLDGFAPAVLNMNMSLTDGLVTQNAVILGGLK